jgi:MFS family permease
VVILGAANGAATLARPALIADFYGPVYYGRISSVMVVFLTAAVTIAPVGAGWMYSFQNSYDPVLWVLFAVACIPIVSIGFVRQQQQLTVA